MTKYSGLEPIVNYIRASGIIKMIETLFPGKLYIATKHTNIAIVSTKFIVKYWQNEQDRGHYIGYTCREIIKFSSRIDANTISTRIKTLAQAGAIKLQEGLFKTMCQRIEKIKLEKLTIDMD